MCPVYAKQKIKYSVVFNNKWDDICNHWYESHLTGDRWKRAFVKMALMWNQRWSLRIFSYGLWCAAHISSSIGISYFSSVDRWLETLDKLLKNNGQIPLIYWSYPSHSRSRSRSLIGLFSFDFSRVLSCYVGRVKVQVQVRVRETLPHKWHWILSIR